MNPRTGYSAWVNGGYVHDFETLAQVAPFVADAFKADRRAEVRGANGRAGGRVLTTAEQRELLEHTTDIILGRRTA